MRLVGASVAALVLSWAGAAVAEPGLGQKVYDPYVRNGLSEVEVRTGRLVGGSAEGDQTTVVELERGINDRFSLAVLGEFEDEPGDARKLDEVVVTNTIPLADNARGCTKIRQLSVAPLIAETIQRIAKGESVMSLFSDQDNLF